MGSSHFVIFDSAQLGAMIWSARLRRVFRARGPKQKSRLTLVEPAQSKKINAGILSRAAAVHRLASLVENRQFRPVEVAAEPAPPDDRIDACIFEIQVQGWSWYFLRDVGLTFDLCSCCTSSPFFAI